MERYPEKFPIGFWNYQKTNQITPEDVKDWYDLGMTFAHSPAFDPAIHSKEEMLATLDACEKYGIRVIMDDERAFWAGAADNPEGYRAQFMEAYEDFGKHPAVFSFHVGDEPYNDQAFADSAAAHRIELEAAPELVPFINFVGYCDDYLKEKLKAPSFTQWLEQYKEKSGLKILCYDVYCQMNPGEEGWNGYFENLRMHVEAANANGIIPWTTLLSVGHFRYRCPSEDDLRWQLNTAVAAGMRGILWFFVYMVPPTSNYRLSAIDEFHERTETFPRLSRVNRHFLKQFGDFFQNATHVATYMTGKTYGGYPEFKPYETNDVILDVTSDHGVPAMLGFFEKDGGKYMAMVNNSTTESGHFRIHVPRTVKYFGRINWDGDYEGMKEYSWDASYYETETECVGGDWLAPGQMKLYRYK